MKVSGEKELLDQVRQGDRDAFALMVDGYRDMVFTLCLRMIGNEKDAEEAAQDVFVKVFNSIGTFRGQSKFSTWLYRITYNQCISVVRKNVRVIDLVDNMEGEEVSGNEPDGLEMLSAADRKKYLQAAMDGLPETDGVVLTLFYYEDLSLDEIAEITGMTNGNIRVRLHRSRKRLYTLLNECLRSEINSLI